MRIFFDENFSPYLANGFHTFQQGRRSEDIDVLHVKSEFGAGCPDEEWIPKVAQQHGCIITQDINIYRVRAQWELCQQYKVGMFFFKQHKKKTYDYWEWIEQVFKWWNHIKLMSKEREKPFAFAYHPNKAKPVDMTSDS